MLLSVVSILVGVGRNSMFSEETVVTSEVATIDSLLPRHSRKKKTITIDKAVEYKFNSKMYLPESPKVHLLDNVYLLGPGLPGFDPCCHL